MRLGNSLQQGKIAKQKKIDEIGLKKKPNYLVSGGEYNTTPYRLFL